MENRYKKIREDYEFLKGGHKMTMEELANIFSNKGYSTLTHAAIRKIETDNRNVSEYELKGYIEVFNTTADYLLGFTDEPSRNNDRVSASNVTGLNGKSIEILAEEIKAKKEGRPTYHLADMINFLLSHTETKELINELYKYFFGNYNQTNYMGENFITLYDDVKNSQDIPLNQICTIFLSNILELIPKIKATIIDGNEKYINYGKYPPDNDILADIIDEEKEYIETLKEIKADNDLIQESEKKLKRLLKF